MKKYTQIETAVTNIANDEYYAIFPNIVNFLSIVSGNSITPKIILTI